MSGVRYRVSLLPAPRLISGAPHTNPDVTIRSVNSNQILHHTFPLTPLSRFDMEAVSPKAFWVKTLFDSQDSRWKTKLSVCGGLRSLLVSNLHPPGVVSNVTDTLLDEPVSGLLGLAFQSISVSGTMPPWLTLVNSPGTLDSPVMAFHLTRFVNDSNARAVEVGGSFSIGAVNSSLYTGEIDYQNIPDGAMGYWVLPMAGMWVFTRVRS